MKALVFHGTEDVRWDDVSEPRIEESTDVLLSVELAGLCGSDLHPYHGREPQQPGTVMGHEGLGTVLECGADVERFRPGDRVVVPFSTACGACAYCERGLSSRCVRGQLFGWRSEGHGLHGLQAERARIPLADSSLVAVPQATSAALLLGDVAATGLYAVRRADASPRDILAVVGCGPVGLLAIAAAKRLGIEQIFAVDPVKERLALAQALGAKTTDIPPADAVVEAVGNAAAATHAMDLLRPGGTLSIAGVHTDAHYPFSPEAAYDKNLTLRVGRAPARSLMEELAGWLRDGYDPAAIVTHTFSLSEGRHAYDIFSRRRDGCIKAVFRP